MLVFACAHGSVEDVLLYLTKVLPTSFFVFLDTEIRSLPLCADLFRFYDVFPHRHLLIYVTYSFHSNLRLLLLCVELSTSLTWDLLILLTVVLIPFRAR